MNVNNQERDGLFIAGLTLSAIVVTATFVIPYFFLISPFVLLASVILVGFSKQRFSIKVLWIFLPTTLLTSLLVATYQVNKMEAETYLIYKDFRGKFVVLFEESCGVDAEYENGRRIYRIPADGVLITKLKREFGIINEEFYLLDNNGNKTQLPKLDRRDFNLNEKLPKTDSEPPRDKLAVFRTNFDSLQSKGRAFTIATYQELKEQFDDDKFYIEFEKKAEKKLLQCRGN